MGVDRRMGKRPCVRDAVRTAIPGYFPVTVTRWPWATPPSPVSGLGYDSREWAPVLRARKVRSRSLTPSPRRRRPTALHSHIRFLPPPLPSPLLKFQ